MASLPAQFRRVIAHTLSADFRAATKIVSVDMADTVAGLEPKQVLVRNIWAGVNASDINYTAGRYVGMCRPRLWHRPLVVHAVGTATTRRVMWARPYVRSRKTNSPTMHVRGPLVRVLPVCAPWRTSGTCLVCRLPCTPGLRLWAKWSRSGPMSRTCLSALPLPSRVRATALHAAPCALCGTAAYVRDTVRGVA